jgi:L-lactate dehydrogenase
MSGIETLAMAAAGPAPDRQSSMATGRPEPVVPQDVRSVEGTVPTAPQGVARDAAHRTAHRVASVAIVGPGLVGATTAYSLLMSGVAAEIVLIGRDRNRVAGHVHDLRDAALYSHPTRIVAGDFADCATADVIIVTVGAPQYGEPRSRLDDLATSAAMLKDVMAEIARQAPTGVVVIAYNPVDVLTYAAWRWSGLPAGRVIGSGTSLDSSRFRRRLGERYEVASEDVHAYVVGEHGDSQVALLSSARIAGMPLEQFCRELFIRCDEQMLRGIAESARSGGMEIARAKGATSYGISAVLTRIATAILRDEHAVLTVSTVVPEKMRLGDVSLSVPAIIGREGVHRILPLRASDEESVALKRSAELLKRHIATLDLAP